jgi:hypothetical protein
MQRVLCPFLAHNSQCSRRLGDLAAGYSAAQSVHLLRQNTDETYTHIRIQGCHVRSEPGDRRLAVGPQPTRRMFEAVLRGGPLGHELPSPYQEGASLFGLRVRERARPPAARPRQRGPRRG